MTITLRLTQKDVLIVRKRALESLAEREIRCGRLDGVVVETVIQEYIKYLDGRAKAALAPAEAQQRWPEGYDYDCDCGICRFCNGMAPPERGGGEGDE